MGKTIIDASNLTLGRLGTIAAKEALLGNSVDIINCEKCVIKGSKEDIISKYRQRLERGTHSKGPFFYRKPNLFVKRSIRGMLNYKNGRGKEAFNRIKCYLGMPENFNGQNIKTFDEINILKQKYKRAVGNIKVGELCKLLGWK